MQRDLVSFQTNYMHYTIRLCVVLKLLMLTQLGGTYFMEKVTATIYGSNTLWCAACHHSIRVFRE